MLQLLGLDFADLDAVAAAELIAARPAGAAFGYVVTPNADHLVRLHRHGELQGLYAGALLRLLDSRVVATFGRMLRLPVPRVAPGSDLTSLLLLQHLRPGERVTIVGLAPRWLAQLQQRCGLIAPAHFDPPHGFEHDPAALHDAVTFVLQHPARFVFLAVGSPRQEKLAAAVQASGRATGVGLCVGASLEFLAGAQPRAPRWLQQMSLEWLHRLAHHPARLGRRYLIDSPAILPLLLREWAASLARSGHRSSTDHAKRAIAWQPGGGERDR